MILGVLCGVASWAFIRLLVVMEDNYPRLPGNAYTQNVVGMAVIGLMMIGLIRVFGHGKVGVWANTFRGALLRKRKRGSLPSPSDPRLVTPALLPGDGRGMWADQISVIEARATISPSTTQAASAWCRAAKPRTHGEAATARPTTNVTHSSHSANCTSAAIAMTAITTPPTHEVLAAVRSPAKPRAQGEMKSSTPQTRLIQSWTFFSAPRNEAFTGISISMMIRGVEQRL